MVLNVFTKKGTKMNKEELDKLIHEYIKNNLKLNVTQENNMFGVISNEIKISLKLKDEVITTDYFKVETN